MLFKRLGKVIKLANMSSRVNYYHDCLGKFNNPKKTWNFINTSLGRHRKKDLNLIYDGELIENEQTKPNIFNQYFIQSANSN